MKKVFLTILALAGLSILHIATVHGQLAPGGTLDPFRTSATSTITPRNPSSSLQIPVLANGTLRCLYADASGTLTLAASACGTGGGGSSTVLTSASSPYLTFSALSNGNQTGTLASVLSLNGATGTLTINTSTGAGIFDFTRNGTTLTVTIPAAHDQFYAPSTTIPTSNNQITNGAGYVTSTISLSTSTKTNTFNVTSSGNKTFTITIPPANDQYFAPSTTIPTTFVPTITIATSTKTGTFNVTSSGNIVFTITIPPAGDQYFAPSTTIPINDNQIANGAGYITGNQSITLNISGDVTSTCSGATTLNCNATTTGILGKSIPSLSSGTLYYLNGVLNWGNAVDKQGNQYVTSTGASSGGVATTSVFSAGFIPVTSSSLALTNSVISQSGNSIGIGTASPVQTLTVVGNIECTQAGNCFFILNRTSSSSFATFQFQDASTTVWTVGTRNDHTDNFTLFNDSSNSTAATFYPSSTLASFAWPVNVTGTLSVTQTSTLAAVSFTNASGTNETLTTSLSVPTATITSSLSSTKICLGGTCNTAWPGSGSGVPSTTPFATTGIVYDNGGSLSASTTAVITSSGYVSSTQICLGGVCNSSWPSGTGGGVATSSPNTSGTVQMFSGTNAITDAPITVSGNQVTVGSGTPDFPLVVGSSSAPVLTVASSGLIDVYPKAGTFALNFGGSFFNQTTQPATFTNTTASSSIIGTGVGTTTIPANVLNVGSEISLNIKSPLTKVTGADAWTWWLNVGTNRHASGAAAPLAGSNGIISVQCYITITAIGASGSYYPACDVKYVTNTVGTQDGWFIAPTATSSIDTTIANKIDFFAGMASAQTSTLNTTIANFSLTP